MSHSTEICIQNTRCVFVIWQTATEIIGPIHWKPLKVEQKNSFHISTQNEIESNEQKWMETLDSVSKGKINVCNILEQKLR